MLSGALDNHDQKDLQMLEFGSDADKLDSWSWSKMYINQDNSLTIFCHLSAKTWCLLYP